MHCFGAFDRTVTVTVRASVAVNTLGCARTCVHVRIEVIDMSAHVADEAGGFLEENARPKQLDVPERGVRRTQVKQRFLQLSELCGDSVSDQLLMSGSLRSSIVAN